MTGRVLNFSEFQDKYSSSEQSDSGSSYSELSTASDSFQTAFDDASYEGPQLGPKRPISGGSEITPVQPGESGAPAFNSAASGIEVPEYTEDGSEIEQETEDTTNPTFGNYNPNSSGNPEEEEDDEEEEEEDNEEEEEEEDEEKNESRSWNRRKSSMILESFESFSMSNDPLGFMDDTMQSEYEKEDEDLNIDEPENWVKCQSCGSTKAIDHGHDPFSDENVDDPNEWWQGQEFGMQCGCNM
jgi:hypothetical protein